MCLDEFWMHILFVSTAICHPNFWLSLTFSVVITYLKIQPLLSDFDYSDNQLDKICFCYLELYLFLFLYLLNDNDLVWSYNVLVFRFYLFLRPALVITYLVWSSVLWCLKIWFYRSKYSYSEIYSISKSSLKS